MARNSGGNIPRSVTLTENEIRQIVQETVNATLTRIGVDHSNPFDMQADFQYLRERRVKMEALMFKIYTTAALTVVGSIIAFLLYSLFPVLKQ